MIKTGIRILLSAVLAVSATFSFGQDHSCGQSRYRDLLDKKHPELLLEEQVINERVRTEVQKIMQTGRGNAGKRLQSVVYTIPVVVHVMHLPGTPVGTNENLSEATIQQGIAYLNDAFRNMGIYSVEHGVDIGINFCLASRDPKGRITNGITRTGTSYSNLQMADDDFLKDQMVWDTYKYLNIWLVKDICHGTECNVAGYSTLASSHGRPWDGFVAEASTFGSSKSSMGTAIHELGHYLNLEHTFTDDGSCTNNNCLTDGDYVCDTPPQNTDAALLCSMSRNSCTTDEDDTSANNPFRPIALGGIGDQNDLIENYMNYGYMSCKNSFTQGQKERMIASLTQIRFSLLDSDGCLPVTEVPVTAFRASSDLVCLGETITFTDTSLNGPTAYQWAFQGGLPASSAEEAPAVTYNQPGRYNVSLSTESSLGPGNTLIKENYITVASAPQATCSNATTQILSSGYQFGIYNVKLNTLDYSTGGTFHDNGYVDFSCSGGTVVEAGKTYPFSVTLGNVNAQYVKVYIDWNDNGSLADNSEMVWSSSAGFRGTITGEITIPVTAVQNKMLRMRVISDLYSISSPCNSISYGQAEDYSVYVVPALISSTNTFVKTTVSLYPNPVNNRATFRIDGGNAEHAIVNIEDLSGRSLTILHFSGDEAIMEKGDLKAGVYIYKITRDNKLIAAGKLIIQ